MRLFPMSDLPFMKGLEVGEIFSRRSIAPFGTIRQHIFILHPVARLDNRMLTNRLDVMAKPPKRIDHFEIELLIGQ